MIIEKGEREWRCHKAIICPQSKVIDLAINSGFKVCLTQLVKPAMTTKHAQESVTSRLPLPDDDSLTIQAMVDFCYEGDYGDSAGIFGDIAPMLLDVWMYTLADKLDMTHLAKLASKKFCARAPDDWKTVGFA